MNTLIKDFPLERDHQSFLALRKGLASELSHPPPPRAAVRRGNLTTPIVKSKNQITSPGHLASAPYTYLEYWLDILPDRQLSVSGHMVETELWPILCEQRSYDMIVSETE